MDNNLNLKVVIKICVDPTCSAIWHNIPKSYTKCNDCGARVIYINENTFYSKFSNNWFQYDFLTNEYFRPQKLIMQLSLNF